MTAPAVKTKARKPGDCPKHRAWVRLHPCLKDASGFECRGSVQAAHIRSGTDGGTGKKPHDRWCVPLCAKHHAEQHRIGEATFWRSEGGVDLVRDCAKFLTRCSPDHTVREPR